VAFRRADEPLGTEIRRLHTEHVIRVGKAGLPLAELGGLDVDGACGLSAIASHSNSSSVVIRAAVHGIAFSSAFVMASSFLFCGQTRRALPSFEDCEGARARSYFPPHTTAKERQRTVVFGYVTVPTGTSRSALFEALASGWAVRN
jgi:hypothetical protein